MAAVPGTVLCTLALPEPGPARLAAVAELRVMGRIPSATELQSALREGVDVLCPQLRDRIDADVLDAGRPRLRAVCTYAVGYDNVDVPAATARGVIVANTPGVLTDATADCAMGLILAAARRLCEGDRLVRQGHFSGWEPEFLLGLDLHDALLGVVGFGRIGQAVARRALGFSMRVAVAEHSPAPPVADDLRDRVQVLPLPDLLREADVISLHLPLTAATHHLIDAAALRLMKPTAVLVNTARGAIVDEAALTVGLREGWIAGAGLDVYEDEPRLSPGLVDCDTAVLSPHLGSATVRTRAAMAELCAENAVAALAGQLPRHAVNPEAWASPPPPLIGGR
jgi:glyoxylate reductase